MNELLYIISNIFFFVGTIFFLIGTLGVFRFFDLYTRLHALAKVDNLGVGFIVLGLILKSSSFLVSLKLIFIWVLILISSSTITYILASHSNKSGEKPILKNKKSIKNDN
ncbi:MAG: monovalent cation/H(+) antiporter subunit G [Campylobacterota bacterium]